MSNTHPCPTCGAEITSGGLCVACALGDAFAEPGTTGNGSLGRIGGYELIEIIARGGMGIVYRARQSDPAREVALKALPGAELTSNEARQRFRIESQAMAKLEHPHILPVYELGEEDTTPFFTMKLAAGGTLSQRMEAYAGQWRQIAEFIATIADAVQFAHSHGVLHRDLKPGNVLFGEDDTIYVSDFGLAKLVGTDTDLTRTIAMMGTPTYLAPELVNGGKGGASAASDLWSLGVILYELLAGRPPFQAENVAALLRMISEQDPQALIGANAIPRDLAVITFKALAKDPARRYRTAQDLADDLRRWLAGEPIHARPVPLAERAWLWAKRKPAIAALLSLLILTLVGSAVLLVRKNDHLRVIDAERRAQIHSALLEKATAERQSRLPGRRERALALVRDACIYGSSVQARSVAASVLAIRDISFVKASNAIRFTSRAGPPAFTPDLNHYIAMVPDDLIRDKSWKNGALGLWRTSDLEVLKQVPLSDSQTLSNVAISSDARWVSATVGDDKLVIWDMKNERFFTSIESSEWKPAAEFDHTDDSLVAVINGRLQRIRLPRGTSGTAQTRNLGGAAYNWNIGHAIRVCLSPDGRALAVQHSDKIDGSRPSTTALRSYPTESKDVFDYKIPITEQQSPTMTWSANGLELFSFNSSQATLMMVRTTAPPARLPVVIAPVVGMEYCVAANPDERTLGWADESGLLRLEDRWAGQTEFQFPAASRFLVFAFDGRRFAYSPMPDRVALAEMHQSPVLKACTNRTFPWSRQNLNIQQFAASPDGRWFATCDRYCVALWRTSDMKCVAANVTDPKGTLTFSETTFDNLHFSDDSRHIYLHEAKARCSMLHLVEHPDGTAYLAGLGRATLMTDEGAKPLSETSNWPHEVSPLDLVAASPGGEWHITTRPDESASVAYLWRQGVIASKTGHPPEPAEPAWRTCLVSPDGRWWAVGACTSGKGGLPGYVYIESTDAGQQRTMLSKIECHSHLAVSPDSRWLLGSEGADYVIWDSTTWQPSFRLPAALSDSVPGSAAFSPDGTLLALEVDHGKIRLLRVGTWEEVLTITPPQDIPIERMAFSPDGRHLYTTGGQILHRWDIEKLQAELTAMRLGW